MVFLIVVASFLSPPGTPGVRVQLALWKGQTITRAEFPEETLHSCPSTTGVSEKILILLLLYCSVRPPSHSHPLIYFSGKTLTPAQTGSCMEQLWRTPACAWHLHPPTTSLGHKGFCYLILRSQDTELRWGSECSPPTVTFFFRSWYSTVNTVRTH